MIILIIFRSLCLLKLGEGEAALQDVQMAISAGYPEENRFLLMMEVIVTAMTKDFKGKRNEKNHKNKLKMQNDSAGYPEENRFVLMMEVIVTVMTIVFKGKKNEKITQKTKNAQTTDGGK